MNRCASLRFSTTSAGVVYFWPSTTKLAPAGSVSIVIFCLSPRIVAHPDPADINPSTAAIVNMNRCITVAPASNEIATLSANLPDEHHLREDAVAARVSQPAALGL